MRVLQSICPALLAGLLAFLVLVVAGLPAHAAAMPSPSSDPDTASTAETIRLAQYYSPYYAPPRPKVRPRKRYRKKKRKRRSRVAKTRCEHPWTYSRGLRRCICTQEGYGLSGDKCLKLADLCKAKGRWSEEDKVCRCNDGLVLRNGQCVDPKAMLAALESRPGVRCLWPQIPEADGAACTCAPGYKQVEARCVSKKGQAADEDARLDRANGLPTDEVALVQQCLKEAGYLRSSISSRMTKRAWTAFWYFKQDYRIESAPKGVHEVEVQRRLFDLCPLTARAVRGPWRQQFASRMTKRDDAAGAADAEPFQRPGPLPPQSGHKAYAKPEAACLPGDLHQLIKRTYGARPGLKRCRKTCLAIPRGLSKRDLAALEQRGIVWCRSCLEVSTILPLEDILRLERGAKVQICPRPPTQLPRWQRADGAPRVAYTKVRELYRTLPTSNDHADDIAVVVGNKNYHGGLPANESAHQNAGAIYALLTEHLGFAQENIIDLRDATLEDLEKVFGTDQNPKGELGRRLEGDKDDKKPSVLIYFAGHGTTSLDGSESYLLPVDAVQYREERTAFAMSRFYSNIAQLGARSVMVLLEAGFGRDHGSFVFPPNLAEISVHSLPRQRIRRLTVMTAANGNQRTMDDPAYGIGLFTRYLIEGLAGSADLAPIGNGDGRIDTVELYAFTAHMVRLSAKKSYGLLQKPLLSRTGNGRISTVQVEAR